MGGSAKTPSEDPSSIALRKRQAEQLLQLDEDANTRIKRMYSASQGLRIARGSADSRIPAGNSTQGARPADYGVKMSDAKGYAGSGFKSAKRKSRQRDPRSGTTSLAQP